MKKLFIILILSLLFTGCCSYCKKHCKGTLIPDEIPRPPIFLADTKITDECSYLFKLEYSVDIDIKKIITEAELKDTYKEKVLVLLEKTTYSWLKHGKLLESQIDLVGLCLKSIETKKENIIKRNEAYCREYKMIYSTEVDRCVDGKKEEEKKEN
jgi:hypothetical protein